MISIILMVLALISCAASVYLGRPVRRDAIPLSVWVAMVVANAALFTANLGWLFWGVTS